MSLVLYPYHDVKRCRAWMEPAFAIGSTTPLLCTHCGGFHAVTCRGPGQFNGTSVPEHCCGRGQPIHEKFIQCIRPLRRQDLIDTVIYIFHICTSWNVSRTSTSTLSLSRGAYVEWRASRFCSVCNKVHLRSDTQRQDDYISGLLALQKCVFAYEQGARPTPSVSPLQERGCPPSSPVASSA